MTVTPEFPGLASWRLGYLQGGLEAIRPVFGGTQLTLGLH
jgi:hypothetical protein